MCIGIIWLRMDFYIQVTEARFAQSCKLLLVLVICENHEMIKSR